MIPSGVYVESPVFVTTEIYIGNMRTALETTISGKKADNMRFIIFYIFTCQIFLDIYLVIGYTHFVLFFLADFHCLKYFSIFFDAYTEDTIKY